MSLLGCVRTRRHLRQASPKAEALRPRRPAIEILEDRCLLSYSILDLGTLGGNASYAWGINASNQVAGRSFTPDFANNGFITDHSQTMMDLPPLDGGGANCGALALNDGGVAVGWSEAPPDGNFQHATMWNGGTASDLGTLGGPTSVANAVNNLGQVVGGADLTNFPAHDAFVADSTGMTDLSTLGGVASEATGINDASQIVGYSLLTDNTTKHAFFYTADAGMMDLGTLGGTSSQANAINQLGDVAGWAQTADLNLTHAFLDINGNMADLGALGTSSQALALNNLDQVVGTSDNHAFLYDSGVMTQLDSLLPQGSGWTLTTATGVNDNGAITGFGTNADGKTHAFLMTPDQGPDVHASRPFHPTFGHVGTLPPLQAFASWERVPDAREAIAPSASVSGTVDQAAAPSSRSVTDAVPPGGVKVQSPENPVSASPFQDSVTGSDLRVDGMNI